MAIYAKIHSASFVDDSASADVNHILWLICDDADADYIGGSIRYNFVNNAHSVQGLNDLDQVAPIKTAIDAIKLARAKDGTYFASYALPSLVSSVTEKDGSGNVTSYIERY